MTFEKHTESLEPPVPEVEAPKNFINSGMNAYPKADAKIQQKFPTINEEDILKKAQKGCRDSQKQVLELKELHAKNSARLDTFRFEQEKQAREKGDDDFSKAYRNTLKEVPGEFGTSTVYAHAEQRLTEGLTSKVYNESVAQGAKNLLRYGMPREKVELILRKSPFMVCCADNAKDAKDIIAMSDEELADWMQMEDASDSDCVEANVSRLDSVSTAEEADSDLSDGNDMAPDEREEEAAAFEDAGIVAGQTSKLVNHHTAAHRAFRVCKMTVEEAKKIETSKCNWSARELDILVKEMEAALGEGWRDHRGGEKLQVYADICACLQEDGFQRSYFAVSSKVRDLRNSSKTKVVHNASRKRIVPERTDPHAPSTSGPSEPAARDVRHKGAGE